mmetsp:Transcript_23927/g.68883  ORF Transcript_23927/g.68883 Transcript_23927/m.68883 type:complete len:280 (+) Transcript_23927:151-990(+)
MDKSAHGRARCSGCSPEHGVGAEERQVRQGAGAADDLRGRGDQPMALGLAGHEGLETARHLLLASRRGLGVHAAGTRVPRFPSLAPLPAGLRHTDLHAHGRVLASAAAAAGLLAAATHHHGQFGRAADGPAVAAGGGRRSRGTAAGCCGARRSGCGLVLRPGLVLVLRDLLEQRSAGPGRRFAHWLVGFPPAGAEHAGERRRWHAAAEPLHAGPQPRAIGLTPTQPVRPRPRRLGGLPSPQHLRAKSAALALVLRRQLATGGRLGAFSGRRGGRRLVLR